MLSDRTEALEDGIGACPDCELGVDDLGEFIERAEESVVEPKPSEQLPGALDGIEFWTVGREEMERKIGFLVASPFRMERSMVILGIVGDDDDTPAGATADAAKLAQEAPTGLGVEAAFRFGSAKLAVPDSHRTEVADTLAGGRVQTNRIFDLRRNPHPAATAVLLEMDLIHRPEIDVGSLSQFCKAGSA
jgi:hypothetical protein